MLGGVATAVYRYAEVWTPLERQYLGAYVWSAAAVTARGEYEQWQVIDQKGRRLALDEELVTITNATGETSFALSDTALKAGAMRLVSQRETYDHTALDAFLRTWIYRGQTLLDLMIPALWGTLALFVGGVIGARAQAVADARRWRVDSRPGPPPPPSVIIDHVERLPHALASAPTVERRNSPQGLAPGPTPRPSTPTSASATAGMSGRSVLPAASSTSWPDPFFQ
jgi:hypothetical protein